MDSFSFLPEALDKENLNKPILQGGIYLCTNERAFIFR